MKIFYSWQSDINKAANCNFIQKAINSSISKIENENPGILLVADRDTKGKSGAINIADTILAKISSSDILIFDISIINSGQGQYRKCINPNVAFELGYGISKIGWEKTILIFNEEYGSLDNDIPFDIRGHRVLSYSYDGDPQNGKNKLNEVSNKLKSSIEDIINNPNFGIKNTCLDNSDELKQQKDYAQIVMFLEEMHIPTFNIHFQTIRDSNTFRYDILHYYEGIKTVVQSLDFHLYDIEMSRLIEEFVDEISKSLSYSNYFYANGNLLRLEDYKIEEEFRRHSFDASNKLKDLLKYIKEKFPNIDYNETNKRALEGYKRIQETIV
ncbi:hypothetical protein CCS79_03045 [Clostridium diolis]|uniref:hypothetical protein n=1 Tax=Clostridium diolis TaxID=223919 RepID=UPI000B400BE4|nr:hypothetical protein [Clostridium diolis]OVE70002.1 hypothetical protein CCS79_03045 [Clostridium diolis]